jgi:hypothetical protein
VHERADAHQTRLERHIDIRSRKPVVADDPRGLADHKHLRMRGRITRRDRLIERTRHDLVVDHQHGADRHLARGQRKPRLFERGIHELLGHALILPSSPDRAHEST